MSRSTSVSRNGVGSAAIAARSCSASVFGDQCCLRRAGVRVAWLDVRRLDRFEILDRADRCRTVLVEPGIGGVAHDAEHPGAGTAAGEATNGA